MKKTFNLVPQVSLPRSKFDLSFEHKTTIPAGRLIPVCMQEILPGDSFTMSQTALLRFTSPLVTPLMDTLELKFEWFFVPNRLVDAGWQEFMGEQSFVGQSTWNSVSPSMSVSEQLPYHDPDSGVECYTDLLRYAGIPFDIKDDYNGLGRVARYVNMLPFKAYWKIWDDWYRDENLMNPLFGHPVGFDYVGFNGSFTDLTSSGKATFNNLIQNFVDSRSEVAGNNPVDDENDHIYYWRDDYPRDLAGVRAFYSAIFKPALRCKKHDYFTSALPWPQKGPGVEVLLGSLSSNVGVNVSTGIGVANKKPVVFDKPNISTSTGTLYSTSDNGVQDTLNLSLNKDSFNSSFKSGMSINSLRQAFQLQKFYERDARGGSRYIEILRSHFGVVSPDARLQRSEYLGGSTIPVTFQSVPQTSGTTDTSPQGNLVSFGIAMGNTQRLNRSFTEHGWLICLASVVSKPSYSQGVDRKFYRKRRTDYYFPSFAHLSEQAILNRELYFQEENQSSPDYPTVRGTEPFNVWGYQERYAEYRFNKDMLTNGMAPRSYNSSSLRSWTLSQEFRSFPFLSPAFLAENPPIERVVAYHGNNYETGLFCPFILDVAFNIHAVRVMPVYGVPGLVDHF